MSTQIDTFSSHKKTIYDFYSKSKLTHGDRYDYSLVDYINNKTKVKIICKIHGIFEQQPSNHLNGNGCPKCSKTKDITEYIIKFKKIHNNKYDYSESVYINAKTKIKIKCYKHGTFEQRIDAHMGGKGCPICSGNLKNNTNSFILKANIIHKNKYDYSFSKYINNITKIKIVCPKHGVFKQTPNSHLSGKGCKKCLVITNTDFINKAISKHGNKYDYSVSEYNKAKNKVKIICPKHGTFEQTPDAHLYQKQGCPKCSLKYDKLEKEIKDFISSLKINFEENNRTIISPLELDIYIPSHKLAIEFNGLYWHSELHKPSNYHLTKTLECEKQGIQLIHIFEDEWVNKQDIVKSRLKNILGLTTNKIYARKCIVKEVSTHESKYFLNNNHLQGYVHSSIRLGLYYNSELVSLMCFIKRTNKTETLIELNRFSNKLNTIVIGGANKLLQYYIKTKHPNKIVSYSDRRWSKGELYNKLDFYLVKTIKPSYSYVINNNRYHKFNFRKTRKMFKNSDKNKSEHQLMIEKEIYRIYDCGLLRWDKNI